MKIVQISIYPGKGEKHANAGGVSSYTKNLMTAMVSGAYEDKEGVFFVLCQKINGRYESYEENGIRIVRCFDRTPKFLWQILKEVKKISPDVVHIQQELALFGNVFTAYLLQWAVFFLKKYRPVITLHGVVSLRKIDKEFVKTNNSNLPVWLIRLGFYIIYKPLCVFSKRIIVHEDVFKRILAVEYGVKQEKIAVIHHGVEDLKSITKEEACRQLQLDSTKDIVLFMGYLAGYKGLDLLLDSFSSYAEKNQKAFLVIGSGKHPKLANDSDYKKDYERILRKAKEKIRPDQYRWDGFINEKNIVNYYSAADVSVYPYTISMSSSGPMAFAIGYEKPFLASDVFRGIIDDEAFLFTRTEEGLLRRLSIFFEDKDSFSTAIREIKSERLWPKIAKETVVLYKNLL